MAPARPILTGTRLRTSFLLEQMIIYSDDMTTDILLRSVGIARAVSKSA